MKTARCALLGLIILGLLSALPAAQSQAAPTAAPVPTLGRIDTPTKDRLRRIWQVGRQVGRRPHVLAKIGDSITSSGSFLSDIGDGNVVLGPHRKLAPIIAYYRSVSVDHAGGVTHNSLNRHSLAAHSNWTAADLLAPGAGGPGASLLQQEYDAISPSVAIIMIGTNDTDRVSTQVFRNNLADVVDTTLQDGIVPILSTIPDRPQDQVAARRVVEFNGAIRDLAALEHVPLIDYWAGLQSLPNHGLSADMVHPSIYPSNHPHSGSVTFTPRALTFGWNLRNYLTLEMLARFKRIVIDDGPPDP